MNTHLTTLNNQLRSITASKPNSAILLAAGIVTSQQSVSIKIGNELEKWWNSIIKTLDTSATHRQVDFFAEIGGTKYYLEFKCNTDLDSEKSKATLAKIQEVKENLEADVAEIFNPVVTKDYFCSKLKRNIVGVESLIQLFNLEFTAEEYQKTWVDAVRELFNIQDNNAKTNSEVSGRKE